MRITHAVNAMGGQNAPMNHLLSRLRSSSIFADMPAQPMAASYSATHTAFFAPWPDSGHGRPAQAGVYALIGQSIPHIS